MLGFIGFILAAIMVGSFALSFHKSFYTLNDRQRNYFTISFLLLATAFAVWSLAPLLDTQTITEITVLIGDALLILGGGFLIAAQKKNFPIWGIIVMALLGSILIGLRAFVYEPNAFVQNSILHFNLEGIPRITVLAILTLIWVPLGARITQLAVQSRGTPRFNGIVSLAFIMALICAIVFVGSRQSVMIIASFAALIFSFLLLTLIPILIDRYIMITSPKQKKLTRAEAHHGK